MVQNLSGVLRSNHQCFIVLHNHLLAGQNSVKVPTRVGSGKRAKSSSIDTIGLWTRDKDYTIYIQLKIIVSFFLKDSNLLSWGVTISGSLFIYFFIKWISSP